MIKEKRKQIILIVLAFVFLGIGVFNFNYQYKSIEVAAEETRNDLNLGDVQLVNTDPLKGEEEYISEIVSNEELDHLDNQIKQTESNTEIDIDENNIQSVIAENTQLDKLDDNQYFVETRLQRDTMYSEILETYQKMLENTEIGEAQKAIATQEITNINNIKNGVMIAENLIKNKGFEDVVILVNNGVVSVVVKSSLLNQEQIAKIQNIVSRELKVELNNINISKK